MPVFNIHHITRYQYDRPVKESVSQIRIFPLNDAQQQVKQFDLIISNEPFVEMYTDYYGNKVGDFTVLKPHQFLNIESRLTVETFEVHGPRKEDDMTPEALAPLVENDINLMRMKDPERIEEQDVINTILGELVTAGKTISEIGWSCCEYIYRNFKYEKGITSVETTIDEILAHKSGVCQDFAHIMLQMLRTLGIPARYVSGYICPNKTGLRGEGATHAWVEFYSPASGWTGIDPTNNVWVNGFHVKLATGRDFNDCSPVKGTFKGIAKQALSVYVSIGYEDGRVFEDINEVKLVMPVEEGMETWQTDWMQAQQQQQQ